MIYGTKLTANQPVHAELGRPVAGCLSARAVQGFEPLVARAVDEHVDTLERELDRAGTAAFAALVSDPLPVAVVCPVLGIGRVTRAAHSITYTVEVAPSRSN